MKKTYLIIGGVITIALLLVIWLYLLIYGTPKNVENFFTDFSFSGNSEIVEDVPFIAPPEESVVNVEREQLRQLTTRSVIGFREIVAGESRNLYYAEAGTGHVYSIDLLTGAEERISNTTILNADEATFSPDGTYMAVRGGYTSVSPVTLVNLSNRNAITTETLTQQIIDYTFTYENNLYYSEYRSNGVSGVSINPETKVQRDLFSIPFQMPHIVWSTASSTPHYVYPKASSKLTGYLYSLPKGVLKRERATGLGLTALANDTYIVTTTLQGENPQSAVVKIASGDTSTITTVVEPNKCVFSNSQSNILYCGSSVKEYGYEFPDNWYKGLVNFADILWRIDINRGSATQLINPEFILGRTIDVTTMSINASDTVLYFTNKNDNTLWMYEI